MVHIRTMTADDIPLGMRLKDQAGFNQTEADWRRLLDLEPEGCFVAELDGQPVGTVTNCVFDTSSTGILPVSPSPPSSTGILPASSASQAGSLCHRSVGWIAMLLVDQRVRGQGIGTQLTEHALAFLDRRGVGCVRLDATPRGRPIYEKLGFVAEYELARLEGVVSGGRSHGNITTLMPDELDSMIELDQQVTSTNRRRLIERLYRERPDATFVFRAQGRIAGYLTLRDGAHAIQIGPGVALTAEAGRALGDVAMERCAGQRLFVDVPTDNAPAMQWAESKGLVVGRCFTRMRRGEPVVDHPPQLWASSGPEKG